MFHIPIILHPRILSNLRILCLITRWKRGSSGEQTIKKKFLPIGWLIKNGTLKESANPTGFTGRGKERLKEAILATLDKVKKEEYTRVMEMSDALVDGKANTPHDPPK